MKWHCLPSKMDLPSAISKSWTSFPLREHRQSTAFLWKPFSIQYLWATLIKDDFHVEDFSKLLENRKKINHCQNDNAQPSFYQEIISYTGPNYILAFVERICLIIWFVFLPQNKCSSAEINSYIGPKIYDSICWKYMLVFHSIPPNQCSSDELVLPDFKIWCVCFF